MFITTKVFDPALEGKAVYLNTKDTERNGFYVVSRVEHEDLHLVDHTALVTKYHVSFFDDAANTMHVLFIPGQVHVEPGKGKHARGFKRINADGRKFRTDRQIRQENRDVERILSRSIFPMKLADVIIEMHKLGHTHWNNKNASGFVQNAIRKGKRIYKVKLGVYAYGYGSEAAQ